MKMRCQLGRFHCEASSPGLQLATILLCAHMTTSLCTRERRRARQLSGVFSYKDTNSMRSQVLRASLRISFNLNYFLGGPMSKYSHMEVRASI